MFGNKPFFAVCTAPSRSSPEGTLLAAIDFRSRIRPRKSLVWVRIAAPDCVGRTVRPERNRRRAPISPSSARIRCATAADVKLRRRAASASEPCSATATKLSRNRVSIANKNYRLKQLLSIFYFALGRRIIVAHPRHESRRHDQGAD